MQIRMAAAACAAVVGLFAGTTQHARAQGGNGVFGYVNGCSLSPAVVSEIQAQLLPVVDLSDHDGSLFNKMPQMWSAVVDRYGRLCSVVKNGDAWPGSRAIAIAKAETANDFSNDYLALSTANIYGPTQPSGSLYGLNNSNPFNPRFLPQGTGTGDVPGGIITFGGGVALYKGGQVIGGLGVSGDSSCADHAIAYRMRARTAYATIPGGVAPDGTDNIIYATTALVNPATFTQPHCSAYDLTPTQVENPPAH